MRRAILLSSGLLLAASTGIAVAADSPTALIADLERAFQDEDLDSYRVLLSESYEFRSDCSAARDRASELAIAGSMFSAATVLEFAIEDVEPVGVDSTTLAVQFKVLVVDAPDSGYFVSAIDTLGLRQTDGGSWLIEWRAEGRALGQEDCTGMAWGQIQEMLASRATSVAETSWGAIKHGVD